MKKKIMKLSGILMLASVVVMMMPSCKTSKVAEKADSEDMKEITVPLSGKEYHSTKELFRAKSSGKSPDIATAKKIALTNAKAELAGLISTTIKAVTHNYTNQRSVSDAQDFENKFEDLTKVLVNQQLNNTSIIGEKIFKSKTGTIVYWVAIEMPTEAIVAGISKQVSQNKKLQIDYDKKKFEDATKEEFEKMEKAN